MFLGKCCWADVEKCVTWTSCLWCLCWVGSSRWDTTRYYLFCCCSTLESLNKKVLNMIWTDLNNSLDYEVNVTFIKWYWLQPHFFNLFWGNVFVDHTVTKLQNHVCNETVSTNAKLTHKWKCKVLVATLWFMTPQLIQYFYISFVLICQHGLEIVLKINS